MLPKILQLINEDYEIYRSVDQILEAGDWLGQLLTGKKACSASMASYKAMWTPKSGYAFETRLGELHPLLNGMVKAKLSGKIYFPGEKIGRLTAEWAERLGLKEGMAIGSSMIDAHAGIPGCGITRPGQMMLVIGTSTVQAVLENVSYQEKGIYGSVKDTVIPEYYTWESGIAAAGDVFQWFTSQCVPESYIRQAEREGEGIHKLLEKQAQTLKPGESGVMALEWWNGNKTPYIDSNRSGILVGCTLQTRPEETYPSTWRGNVRGSSSRRGN